MAHRACDSYYKFKNENEREREMLETLQNRFAQKTVFIVDSCMMETALYNKRVKSPLLSGLRGLQEIMVSDIYIEMAAVESARELLRAPTFSLVVPLEVRDEIEEYAAHLRRTEKYFRYHSPQFQRRHSETQKKERETLAALRQHVGLLRSFHQESVGFDPRYFQERNTLEPIDTSDRTYEEISECYRRIAMARHMRKGQDLSYADVAIATLSYLINTQQKRDVCILTRDYDFRHMALAATPRAKLEESSDEHGILSAISSPSYSLTIFMPRL